MVSVGGVESSGGVFYKESAMLIDSGNRYQAKLKTAPLLTQSITTAVRVCGLDMETFLVPHTGALQ
jgi:hypothetical protein